MMLYLQEDLIYVNENAKNGFAWAEEKDGVEVLDERASWQKEQLALKIS